MNDAVAAKGPPQRVCELGAYVVGLAFDAAGVTLAVATGAGKVTLLPADAQASDAPREIAVHRGASLSFARDPSGTAFVSGGDDGRVVRVALDGTTTDLLEAKGKWIEAVATHAARKLVAVAVGSNVQLITEAGVHVLGPASEHGDRRLVQPRRHAPRGDALRRRVDPSHREAGGQAEDAELEGLHLAARYSPNAKFLATATQENAIHVWRLASGADMQMQGYATKVKSIAWTADGNWLVSQRRGALCVLGLRGQGAGRPAADGAHAAGHRRGRDARRGTPRGTLRAARLRRRHGADRGHREEARDAAVARDRVAGLGVLDWSPDGWRLAAGTGGGLRLFDLKPRT